MRLEPNFNDKDCHIVVGHTQMHLLELLVDKAIICHTAFHNRVNKSTIK